MKRVAILLVFVGAILLLAQDSLLARGGGGGGGRGGGGGGGGGGARAGGGGGMSAAAGRSPSMGGGMGAGAVARPAARPAGGVSGAARPGTGAAGAARSGAGGGGARPGAGVGGPGGNIAAGTRPSAGQLNNFLDMPRASTGAVGAGSARPGTGGAAADFLQGGGGARPAQLPAGAGAAGAGRPGVGTPGVGRPGAGTGTLPAGGRGQNLSNNRAGRVENRQELQGNRQQRGDEIRNQVAENHPRLDFWSDHPGWARMRVTRPYRWATWGALGGWIGYGAGTPTSYSYGDNVYYQDDQVYYGDQPVATADEYAQQADTIAASAPATKPESTEWMPLGVFALTQDGQASGVEPTLFMQLAISKEGVISGTLNNTATDQVQTLEGMADKKSQRVAWGIAGQKRPIMETGIANLTQDSFPALVHFDDGQTQQWLMVRLPEPKKE